MDKCYSFLTKADILLQRKLTIITKRSILDVAAAIDPPLVTTKNKFHMLRFQITFNYINIFGSNFSLVHSIVFYLNVLEKCVFQFIKIYL